MLLQNDLQHHSETFRYSEAMFGRSGWVVLAVLFGLAAMTLVVPGRTAPADVFPAGPPPRATAAPQPVEGAAPAPMIASRTAAERGTTCVVRCVSWDGEPVPGCEVSARGATAVTGAGGEACVEVPAGTVELHVTGTGWVGVVREAAVPP